MGARALCDARWWDYVPKPQTLEEYSKTLGMDERTRKAWVMAWNNFERNAQSDGVMRARVSVR